MLQIISRRCSRRETRLHINAVGQTIGVLEATIVTGCRGPAGSGRWLAEDLIQVAGKPGVGRVSELSVAGDLFLG